MLQVARCFTQLDELLPPEGVAELDPDAVLLRLSTRQRTVRVSSREDRQSAAVTRRS